LRSYNFTGAGNWTKNIACKVFFYRQFSIFEANNLFPTDLTLDLKTTEKKKIKMQANISTATTNPNDGHYYFKSYMLMLIGFIVLGSILMAVGIFQDNRLLLYLGLATYL
jgi:hypothetical protein